MCSGFLSELDLGYFYQTACMLRYSADNIIHILDFIGRCVTVIVSIQFLGHFRPSATTAEQIHSSARIFHLCVIIHHIIWLKPNINLSEITQTLLFVFCMSVPLSFLPPSVIHDSQKPLLKAFTLPRLICSL